MVKQEKECEQLTKNNRLQKVEDAVEKNIAFRNRVLGGAAVAAWIIGIILAVLALIQ